MNTTRSIPRSLTPQELAQAGGGYQVKLPDLIISSYQTSGSGSGGTLIPIKIERNV